MGFVDTLEQIRRANKKVLVIGLGISGVESARFLLNRGLNVVISDRQTEADFRAKSKFVEAVERLKSSGVEISFGIDGERVAPLLEGVALAVVSPGVPLESSIIGTVRRHDVQIVSELELGVELHGGKSVVVTGSNGKSTTVSLIHYLLTTAGKKAFLCGNVGTPVIASDELSDPSKERSILVVEASSYQLEACSVMKPAVSVLLNVSENHLERHGSLERYAAAKARVMRLQDRGDLCILNADDQIVKTLGQSATSTTAFFGARSGEELGKLSSTWASIQYASPGPDTISLKWDGQLETYDLSKARLMGLHNRYNVAAALLAARAMGVSVEAIVSSLAAFSPLEHRLEVVVRRGGLTVINDSKSTTVAASAAAVSTLAERFSSERLVVMIGGLAKAGSWAPLFDKIARYHGTLVVCFGKDGPLLASHCLASGIDHVVASTLKEGTKIALAKSCGKGIVLLTPGCASFDEFSDFEHRGAEFKRYVGEFVPDADPTH